MCVDQIDADKLALRRQIEESLTRLERETLINRSGDTYFFLTNEERDISREIKGIDLSSGEEAELLGEIIFEDILKGQRKHRYSANKVDFAFARICDMRPVGGRVEGGLVVSVVSPLNDDYEFYKDQRCILESSSEGGQALIRLRDNPDLGREVRAYKKTEKHLKTKSDATLPESAKRILRDNAEDNRERRKLLTTLVTEILVEASYFVAGQPLKVQGKAPGACMDEALEYLIANTFSKMRYIKHLCPEPTKEIQAILRKSDVAELGLDLEESNPQALDDLRNHVDLCAASSRQIVVREMIETRYGRRPYGWPPLEIVLLVARLLKAGEISLTMEGAAIPQERVYENITSPAKWRKITIVKRLTPPREAIEKARSVGKEVFSEMGSDDEDELFVFLQGHLRECERNLIGYRPLAETGDYPGQDEITDGLTVIRSLLGCNESCAFITRFNEREQDLLDLADHYSGLTHFYEHQRPTWERLRRACGRFDLNRLELQQDATAALALRRMQEILSAPSPYGVIHEAEGLITTVDGVNKGLIDGRRAEAIGSIDGYVQEVSQGLDALQASEAVRTACLRPLEALRSQVQSQESIAHVTQAQQEAMRAYDNALARIEQEAKKPEPQPVGGDDQPQPKPVVKPREIIEPAKFVTKAYLETPEDVQTFVTQLREKLDAAIAKGKRIQIR